jgi:hypothetical protein
MDPVLRSILVGCAQRSRHQRGETELGLHEGSSARRIDQLDS